MWLWWVALAFGWAAAVLALVTADLYRRALNRLARHATEQRRQADEYRRALQDVADLWTATNPPDDSSIDVQAFNDFASLMESIAVGFGRGSR